MRHQVLLQALTCFFLGHSMHMAQQVDTVGLFSHMLNKFISSGQASYFLHPQRKPTRNPKSLPCRITSFSWAGFEFKSWIFMAYQFCQLCFMGLGINVAIRAIRAFQASYVIKFSTKRQITALGASQHTHPKGVIYLHGLVPRKGAVQMLATWVCN